jgi:hypothetical protein
MFLQKKVIVQTEQSVVYLNAAEEQFLSLALAYSVN